MSQIIHEVVSPVFHQETAKRCKLVSVVSKQFSYKFVIESNDDKFEIHALISYQKLPKTLPAWLKYSFNEKLSIEQTDLHLLIPNEVFNSDVIDKMMALHVGEKAKKLPYRHEHLNGIGAYLVSYAAYKKCPVSDTFNLLSFLQNFPATNHENLVSVDFRINHILISIFKNGKLQLSNTFEFSHRNDILYYILTCMEKCEMDAAQTPVLASGLLRPNSELMKLLKQYLGNLQTARTPSHFHFHPVFKELPLHFYFSGLIHPLCA